jgi:hypothetical protein
MNATKRIRYFRKFIGLINYYPPFIGAGIKMYYRSPDFTQFKTQMKLRWYNKNLVGTHFGGSLYAMCDPFYVFILVANLGADYIIWDKGASIKFERPGKGKVKANFEIPLAEIDRIRQEVNENGKGVFEFQTHILDEQELIVARLTKQVYVRKKVKMEQ